MLNHSPDLHALGRLQVDVVIPMFNAEPFIERALRSVVAQTRPPSSVTVVDDGSTDASVHRVRSFIAAYSGPIRITLLQQANAGPNTARNRGIDVGDAGLVALLDADDLWERGKLEAQLRVFEADVEERLVLVYCRARWIDADDRPCDGPALNEGDPLRGDVFDALLPRNRIWGGASAVVLRRKAIKGTGNFDADLRVAEDFDMWLRLARTGHVDLADEELVAVRDHGSNTSKDGYYMLAGLLDFYAKWFDHAMTRPDVLHEWGHLIALFALRSNDREAALAVVRKKLRPEQRKLLFQRAWGSLRLYMLLKQLRGHRAANLSRSISTIPKHDP